MVVWLRTLLVALLIGRQIVTLLENRQLTRHLEDRVAQRTADRDGYVAVALGWIVLSAFGALPYALSGCCGYVDALFETVSGFTTTGASIFGAPASPSA